MLKLDQKLSFRFISALHQPTHPTTNPPTQTPIIRYREFTTWTDLNTILYHGSAEDRAESRATEWWFDEGVLDSFLDAAGQGQGKRGGKRGGAGKKLLPKFQVGVGGLVVGRSRYVAVWLMHTHVSSFFT